jgi:signal transduction histidine kinase
LQVTPLRYEGGGAVIAHIDITEQKQLEQRKDDFISMASHELKTPVTSLKMFTQLLRRQIARAGADALLPQFDKMDAQIDRLTRLIQELLDVSRIYAGKLEVRDEPFDLAELVKDTVETFQATVLEHPITLRGGASGRVRGDSDRIEQVLLNLLGNAVKYSPQHAPVEVMIDEHPTGVIVSVQDQGIGIDPRHHDRIFDRFYQVTDSAEKTFPGLGMGLYISKQILQLHHGDLWVESVKGQGAVFRFKLPLAS